VLCELCGKDVARTRTVSIEGSILSVCNECARFGTEPSGPVPARRLGNPVVAEGLERRQRRLTERDVYAMAPAEELVPDFGMRIRHAREARGWKQADLGAKINERASVVAKLETSGMIPTDSLARKLERALEIKLREKPEPVATKRQASRAPMTLGDLVKIEDK